MISALPKVSKYNSLTFGAIVFVRLGKFQFVQDVYIGFVPTCETFSMNCEG